jgi:MFS family permease
VATIGSVAAAGPLSRVGLLRISVYWLALSAIWAGIPLQMAPVVATRRICPAGVEGPVCALLPIEALTPIALGIRLQPEVALGIIALLGAVIAFTVQPLAAALSDHTVTRLGRRRPWVLVGAGLTIAILLLLAGTGTFLGFAVLVLALQFASNVAQGPYQAYIPDLVPERQVGTASGLKAVMSSSGQLVGAGIGGVALWLDDVAIGFLGLAVLVAVTLVPTVVRVADRPVVVPVRAPSLVGAARAAIAEAWANRSYAWVLASMLFAFMGTATLAAMARWFLTRSLGHSEGEATGALLAVLGLTVVSGAIGAAWAGPASDRRGRRPVIWLALATSALGMAVLVIASADPELVVAGVRFPLFGLAAVPVGAGAGMHLAANWALLVDVIPKLTAGRYLGLSNIVTASSGALAATSAALVMAVVTGITQDAGAGPRAAVALAVGWYAVGALALVRVVPGPADPERAGGSGVSA